MRFIFVLPQTQYAVQRLIIPKCVQYYPDIFADKVCITTRNNNIIVTILNKQFDKISHWSGFFDCNAFRPKSPFSKYRYTYPIKRFYILTHDFKIFIIEIVTRLNWSILIHSKKIYRCIYNIFIRTLTPFHR